MLNARAGLIRAFGWHVYRTYNTLIRWRVNMDSKCLKAEEFGIRLEIVQGLPIWEPYPIYKHQKAIDRIRATIFSIGVASEQEGRCSCIHTFDFYVSFPDGSLNMSD